MTRVTKELTISVCVATYNQPTALRLLLEDLSKEWIADEMELVIRDDSTNNESENICKEFSARIPLRYFRGKKEGLDVAIIFLTEQARGTFVWWLGNERLRSGAIAAVMQKIQHNPSLSFLWLNSRNVHDEDDIAFHFSDDVRFRDRDEVITTDIGLLGFISATIFRRENALDGLKGARAYIGTAFVNLYIILHVLSGSGEQILLATPYLLCEPKPAGEVRWYDQFEVFGISLARVAHAFRGRFNARAMRYALRQNVRQVIKSVLVERGMGLRTGFASPNPKIIPLVRTYWNYWEAWVAAPLFALPRPVIIALYCLYKKIISVIR